MAEARPPTKHQRTTERFKYRNAAVRQATYLGLYKTVLVSMSELAHDDGTFWHGYRAIAKICGVSQGMAYKVTQRFIKDGVWILVRKGKGLWLTNLYRMDLDALPLRPTVYDLAKHDRSQSMNSEDTVNRSPDEQLEPSRSPDEQLEPNRSPHERLPFTRRTKDVDLDVDLPSKMLTLKARQGQPVSLLVNQHLDVSQSQGLSPSQNQSGLKPVGTSADQSEATPKATPTPVGMDDMDDQPIPTTCPNCGDDGHVVKDFGQWLCESCGAWGQL